MDNSQHYLQDLPYEAVDKTQNLENTLPTSWYSSQEMYDLERRAIFSKRWLFVSHKSRLIDTGDWVRYSFASYDIIVTRDRTGAINAFHNVCRHRAYPVIEKEGAGNNKILACRYHGWSYGLNGKLAKAPGYQEMNLDKEQNSLFRCHTKIDRNGFIWINLDANKTPEIAFEKHFANVDDQENHSQINNDGYTFICEVKEQDLKINWKHELPQIMSEHIEETTTTTNMYCFPNASSTVSSKFMAITKILPQGPDQTTKHYEIYRHKDCSDAEWNIISKTLTETAMPEKPTRSAPGVFQRILRETILEHYKQEKMSGREIWPSRPVYPDSRGQVDEDEEICAGIACSPKKEVLAW